MKSFPSIKCTLPVSLLRCALFLVSLAIGFAFLYLYVALTLPPCHYHANHMAPSAMHGMDGMANKKLFIGRRHVRLAACRLACPSAVIPSSVRRWKGGVHSSSENATELQLEHPDVASNQWQLGRFRS